jgi:L-asparaginase / beta-aspartyl-peptidase
MWSIIVHGGAGAINRTVEAAHRSGCARAAEAGAAILASGGASIDAACAAARVLEDDPTFNAGKGGALDERGLVSLDAAVMRGSDLAYGAVGAVAGVKNPIDLARAVLEDGRHSLLVGAGALDFARKRGIALADPARLVTRHARNEWRRKKNEREAEALSGKRSEPGDWTPVAEGDADAEHDEGDAPLVGTIGVVARDRPGVICAATSTGGLTLRYAGRVGDSPIAGAGTYARDDLGGASCTGHGETMMKTVLAYAILRDLRGVRAEDATAVLERALADATARAQGKGGVIVLLADGTPAHARNTAHMGCAWRTENGPLAADF